MVRRFPSIGFRSDELPPIPDLAWRKVRSFPIPLRVLFAAHPQLLASVLQIVHRVISTFLIQQTGLKGSITCF